MLLKERTTFSSREEFPAVLRLTLPPNLRPAHEGVATDKSTVTSVPGGRWRQLAAFSDNKWDVPLEVRSRSQLNSGLLIEHDEAA